MLKTSKKITLALGAFATVATPFASIISCGSGRDESTITFGMRFADWEFWKPIADEFTENTGVNVEFKIVGDQIGDYTTWHGAGSMPDVTLADHNTIAYNTRQNPGSNTWFKDIDLDKFGSSQYDITSDVDSEKKEFDITDGSQYDPSIFGSVKSSDTSIGALPYGYSAGTIYFNENMMDTTKNIFAMVPKLDSNGFDSVDTGLLATRDNVAKFVLSSAQEEPMQWEQGIVFPEGWRTHGPNALHQRFASVGMSTLMDDAPEGWEGSNWDTSTSGLIGEIGFSFGNIAELKDIYDQSKKLIDDEKLLSYFKNTNNMSADDIKNDDDMTSGLIDVLYQSIYGYFAGDEQHGNAITPTQLSLPGKAEAMYSQWTSVLEGAKWYMHGYLEPNWYINGKPQGTQIEKAEDLYENLYAVPAPYAAIGYDALALSSYATGAWEENAIKFMRFATSMSNGSTNGWDITAGKVISPVIDAKNKEADEVESIIYYDLKTEYGIDTSTFPSSKDYSEEEWANLVVGGTLTSSDDSKLTDDIVTKLNKWLNVNEGKRALYKTFVQSGLKFDESKNEVGLEGADPSNGIAGGILSSSTDNKYTFFNEVLSNSSSSLSNSFKDPVPVTYDGIINAFKKALAIAYQELEIAS